MKITTPLRIAILINSDKLPEWQFQLLEKIRNNGSGDIILAIIRGKTADTAGVTDKKSLALSLFYRYSNWDRKKFKQSPDPFSSRNLTDLDANVEILNMTPDTTLWTDKLNSTDLETLRSHNIDVIVRLGWRILKGDILTIPHYGVWSYHHGDNRVNRGGPPGVWEHYYKQTCAGVTLQILSEDLDDGIVLDRSLTATVMSSVSKTRDKLYWRSVDMLPRKLTQLKRYGFDAFVELAKADATEIDFYSQPLLTEKKMDLAQVTRFVCNNLYAYIKEAVFERRFEEKWVLYYRLSEQPSTSLWQFSKLESPNDRYWADPHVIKRDGRYYIFVEEFIYATRRGRIAVISIDESGAVSDAQTVLDTDYHLSYPFLFEHDGSTYMIPESGGNRTIELYKCIEFPDKWALEKVLMDKIHAVDTTLYFRDNLWWMFTNIRDTEGGNTHDELHLFSAPHFLDDNWEPHPQGVIVSDVRCARPAGALFERNGKLFRPAQDCSVDYGYAVQLQEITTLSSDQYHERAESRITPDWNTRVQGVHTFNYVKGMTIVDAKTYIKKGAVK